MLKFSILSTIDLIKEKNDNLYWKIKQECSKRDKRLNFDSLIDIMYNDRGKLSHATKRAIYEENPELVRPITTFISFVCFGVCGNMKVYYKKFVSEETRIHRLNEHVQKLEKELNLE